MIGEQVWAEALTWRGTPFHWQASVKGVGCDCKGLISGVARELLRPEAASIPANISDYHRRVPVLVLKAGLAQLFDRASAPERGDILLLRFAGQPQHLAIFGGASVIHTYNAGPKQVVEQSFSVVARAWPVDSIWRWRSRSAES
jgi:cell wall-associated NlpC family hydrolase